MIIMKELLGNCIKAAIFDIDGTLLDSMPMWQDVCARYLISIGITPEPDLSKKVFSMTLKEGCKYTKEQYNLDISEDEIEDGIIKLIEHFYYYEVELKPGAKELIMELNAKNIPMVLATTGDEDLATHALLRNGIFNYFKKLYTCGEYNTSKRERYIFDLAKTELETILGSKLDYENIAVEAPSKRLDIDNTEPEICEITLDSIDDDNAYITLNSYDSDTYVQYYQLSLDGGYSFYRLEAWDDRSSEYQKITVPRIEKDIELVVRTYNQYEFFLDSNSIDIPAKVIEEDSVVDLDENIDDIEILLEKPKEDTTISPLMILFVTFVSLFGLFNILFFVSIL